MVVKIGATTPDDPDDLEPMIHALQASQRYQSSYPMRGETPLSWAYATASSSFCGCKQQCKHQRQAV